MIWDKGLLLSLLSLCLTSRSNQLEIFFYTVIVFLQHLVIFSDDMHRYFNWWWGWLHV